MDGVELTAAHRIWRCKAKRSKSCVCYAISSSARFRNPRAPPFATVSPRIIINTFDYLCYFYNKKRVWFGLPSTFRHWLRILVYSLTRSIDWAMVFFVAGLCVEDGRRVAGERLFQIVCLFQHSFSRLRPQSAISGVFTHVWCAILEYSVRPWRSGESRNN